nr:hypothetical protein [Thiorhodovibrio winogradskyi]
MQAINQVAFQQQIRLRMPGCEQAMTQITMRLLAIERTQMQPEHLSISLGIQPRQRIGGESGIAYQKKARASPQTLKQLPTQRKKQLQNRRIQQMGIVNGQHQHPSSAQAFPKQMQQGRTWIFVTKLAQMKSKRCIDRIEANLGAGTKGDQITVISQ